VDRVGGYGQRIDAGALAFRLAERRDGAEQLAGLCGYANALTGRERPHLHLKPRVGARGKRVRQRERSLHSCLGDVGKRRSECQNGYAVAHRL
jgi:hypothetical protein